MRVVSVNVGRPRELARTGRGPILSGIVKHPVPGRLRVRRTNLEGDEQADLRVHGGPNKAVYAYPSEHYPFWKERFPARDLP